MHTPLLWLDIETTGLDEHASRILEVGLILTDGDLNEIASVDAVIGWRNPHQMVMCEAVREMHTTSGLLDEVAESRMCLGEAEDLLLAWVHHHDANGLLMAGSGVQFDRRWIAHVMPGLADLFHRRNFDMTTLRYFLGEAKEEAPHRALGDLRQNIRTLRRYVARARAMGLIAMPAASVA